MNPQPSQIVEALALHTLTPTNTVTWQLFRDTAVDGSGQYFAKSNTGVIEAIGTNNALASYVATLTQSGTTAPVANVVQNSLLGNPAEPVWSYVGVGDYLLTMANAFPTAGDTIIFTGSAVAAGQTIVAAWISVNTISVKTYSAADAAANGVLTNSAFEITVYP